LNLLWLEADPKILSSADLSLCPSISSIFFLLSGVLYKLLVSYTLDYHLIFSKKSSFSFLIHCAHTKSSLIVSLSTFLLIDQCIRLSMSIKNRSSSSIKIVVAVLPTLSLFNYERLWGVSWQTWLLLRRSSKFRAGSNSSLAEPSKLATVSFRKPLEVSTKLQLEMLFLSSLIFLNLYYNFWELLPLFCSSLSSLLLTSEVELLKYSFPLNIR
jgi:hypothetical protein